ncbi:hypothetical protein B0H21DRAFT_893726 [Amylocystis lapponica]|nr:hypothetical protein B0H21DRAFT_893726 [Amylocystis lapponica]
MTVIPSSAPKSPGNTRPHPMAEQDTTSSRPLSASEQFYVAWRHGVGAGDALPLITLDCSPATPISDANVIVAWAVLRLRHPMLASRIKFATSGAEIVCSSARTQARAIALAEACIEFALFDDRDHAVEALRAQFGGRNPQRTTDIRAEMRVVWYKDTTGERGQYIFGMQTAELDAHFADSTGAVLPPKIPQPVENIFLDLSAYDTEERPKVKEAVDKIIRKADVLRCGLAYDGSEIQSGADHRCIRRTFSELDTALILRACKVHGVTVTQFFLASWAVAAIEIGHEETKDGVHKRPGLSLQNGSYHFNNLLVIDLAPFIKVLPGNNDIAPNISLQLASYISTISISHTTFTQFNCSAVVWGAARRAKADHAAFLQSPYFWHLIIHLHIPIRDEFSGMSFSDSQEEPVVVPRPHPLMPSISGMGDISTLLPSSISASPGADPDCARDGLFESDGRTIRIADMMICVRSPPAYGVSHVWTFNGKMTLQLTYDCASFSPARGDKFFGRVADIVAQVAAQS